MLEIIDLSQRLDRGAYREALGRHQTELRLLGYALQQQARPVVVVFEGWDAAGKGGIIKRMTERMDPRFYVVHPIAKPLGDDADKHYLWRFWRRLPSRGDTAIFDRSWYGRVLVERVEGFCGESEWRRAYREIRDFEQQLVGFGTLVFKFWLHISPDEQLRRFEARQADDRKAWKLTDEDWRNRTRWSEYEAAVEEMLIRTTTSQAPWTIVAANCKRHARVQVLRTLCERLSAELHFDLDAADLDRLPAQAAPVPIPDWALAEARALGIEPEREPTAAELG